MDRTVHSPEHTLQPTEPTHSLIHVTCRSVSTREQTQQTLQSILPI